MIQFADMFCGGGLGARGALDAGLFPVISTDIWDIATQTYAGNFPTAKVLTGSVSDISPLEYCPDGVDLLLTSPECTNHSPAKGAAKRCENSRKTAFAAIEWAEALQPRWIVMENVPQMRNWKRYQELMAHFGQLGYKGREIILNSKDFGVPQSRRRLFVTLEYGQVPAEVKVPKGRKVRTVREILDPPGKWKTTPLETPRRAKPTLKRANAAIAALGKRASFIIVYYGSDGGGGWQTLDEPLRTVTTLDRFALVEFVGGEHRMRMLQPNELAKAMGLKSTHKFEFGTRRDKVKLCGNGICAPVMEHVIKSIIPAELRLGKKAS